MVRRGRGRVHVHAGHLPEVGGSPGFRCWHEHRFRLARQTPNGHELEFAQRRRGHAHRRTGVCVDGRGIAGRLALVCAVAFQARHGECLRLQAGTHVHNVAGDRAARFCSTHGPAFGMALARQNLSGDVGRYEHGGERDAA